MNRGNQNGFIHIIVYLVVFLFFMITMYTCLDFLELIDIPEQYSVIKWIDEKFTKAKDISIDDVVNETKKVKIVVETDDESQSELQINMPTGIKEYSSNANTTSYANNVNSNQNNYDYLYYDQLDNYGKIIYSEIEKNLDNMKTGTYTVDFGTTFDELLHQENGEEVLNNSFQLAINALSFDKPEMFYIDIPKIYLLTKVTTRLWSTTYEVQIGPSNGQNYLNSYFGSESQVNQALYQVRREKENIRSKLKGNIENQIKIVHDYLVDNLEYDGTVSKENIYNIYGALVNKETVCEGYAKAFKYIMDDIGIPCILVCGKATNSTGKIENHAWNYVNINGYWYAIDVTWDDPVIIGNGYLTDTAKYKYYLKGSNEFFMNHTEDGNIVGNSNFKYPTLSAYNY